MEKMYFCFTCEVPNTKNIMSRTVGAFFPVLLKYNWDRTWCKFKVHDVMI